MPIGFNNGDFGGGAPTAPDPPTEPAHWSWPVIIQQLLTPIVYTQWFTAYDERVCPECGPLAGLVWEENDGPTPPLHVNCRCERVYAFTEWQVRTT
jgi:hypothetical protein